MTITYIIIAITVGISLYAFNNRAIMHRFIFNPYVINTQQQYYRFLTSGFIHKDHMHLLLNMIALYFFGGVIEKDFRTIFGSKGDYYYIILYLLAIFVSDIPTYFKNKNNPAYNALGASGGVSAILFAFIILQPLQKVCIYYVICIRGFILGALYIIFSIQQGRKGHDGINHDAHLYGALFGFIFCLFLYPSSLPNFFEQIRQWRMFD